MEPVSHIRRTSWPGALASLAAGLLLAAVGGVATDDPIGRGFWGVVSIVLLLPMAASIGVSRRVDFVSYALACVPIVGFVTCESGVSPAIVVAAVAFSLIGLLALADRLRIPGAFAIGVLIVQSALVLTWPIWAAKLLLKFDSQWLVDLLVKIGPLFAINASLDPTDAFTHRPLAYRLMNLGQDIPYTMPMSIWPCVIVHALTGACGVFLSSLGLRGRTLHQVDDIGIDG